MEVTRWSGDYLRGKGVEDGRLNAEYLLAHVLALDRLQLYLNFDRPLAESELAVYRPLLKRRAAREPLQYLLGSASFRNLELGVDPRVAIPRPETEYMIDVLVRAAGKGRVFESALDIGTGSGAIAIALATEGLARRVTATDLSIAALEVARRNAVACGQPEIDFHSGPLLHPVGDLSFDLVLSNPPYLSEEEWDGAEPEVREWEPPRRNGGRRRGVGPHSRPCRGGGSRPSARGVVRGGGGDSSRRGRRRPPQRYGTLWIGWGT